MSVNAIIFTLLRSGLNYSLATGQHQQAATKQAALQAIAAKIIAS